MSIEGTPYGPKVTQLLWAAKWAGTSPLVLGAFPGSLYPLGPGAPGGIYHMKNLIHTAVVTLFAASAVHAQEAVQWKVSDGGNGHWYVLHPTTESWPALRTISESLGGHLVTLNTIQEWSWVKQNFEIPFQTGRFVGGFQDRSAADFVEPGGGWRWVTGEPFIFDLAYMAPFDDFCGNQQVMYIYGCCNQFLSDIQNGVEPGCDSYLRQAIFEWSADCNSDGIVDYGQCRDGTLPDYNGNNIPDCCERGEVCVVGNYPVQWRIEDGGNGHWYQIRAKVGDWFACRAAAQGLTGDLASPSTVIENSFVERLVPPKQFPIWNRVFLGGRQNNGNAPNEGWYWVDGSAWNYVDWFENQPNGGEGFLVTMPDESGCTWGDYPANSSDIYYFMAEWDADCNSDGIVDYGQVLQGQLADSNANNIPDVCEQPTCVDADIYRDFNVNGADLGIMLSQWGPNTPLTESDLNNDGVVNGADLGLLLSFWGACPN